LKLDNALFTFNPAQYTPNLFPVKKTLKIPKR